MGACRADVYDSAVGRKVVYVRVKSDEEMSRKLEQATSLLAGLASPNYSELGVLTSLEKRQRALASI